MLNGYPVVSRNYPAQKRRLTLKFATKAIDASERYKDKRIRVSFSLMQNANRRRQLLLAQTLSSRVFQRSFRRMSRSSAWLPLYRVCWMKILSSPGDSLSYFFKLRIIDEEATKVPIDKDWGVVVVQTVVS